MVRVGKTLFVCGTKPTPLPTSLSAFCPVMSSPSRVTVPLRMPTRPNTALSSVDFPAPFGPMMPTSSPRFTCRLQPFRMLTPGTYPATRSVVSSTTSPAIGHRLLFHVLADEVRLHVLRDLALAAHGAEVGVVVGAEVGVDHRGVAHDRVRGALGDHPALRHDDDPVGDLAHNVHVVLDEEHGHPLLLEVEDVAEQRLREGRVHAGHRLVEHHEGGVAHQCARHLQQLPLAAGE